MLREAFVLAIVAACAVGQNLPHQQLPIPLENAARYQLYGAYGAYCRKGSIEAWDCKWCKTMGPAKVYGVITRDEYDGQAYVAQMNNSMIILAFRGSHNIENWIENLDYFKTKLTWPGVPHGLEVHRGFLNSYESMRNETKAWVLQAQKDCPRCSFHITGHSLGAALSLLAATDYRLMGQDPEMWTFGQPRVGSKSFVTWFDGMTKSSNPVYRMVNKRDIVPHLPPHDLFYFDHNAREVWRHENGTYIMCNGSGEDHQCSYKVGDFGSVSDHLHYMGIHESC